MSDWVEEACTHRQADSGYWLLGYKATTLNGETMEVKPGATDVVGARWVVETEDEARDFIRCLCLARRATKWNAEEPTDYWSHERAIEALQALVAWARGGTCSYALSHHGIGMPKPVLVGGYPVRMRYSGQTNAIYAYEKHWDLHDIVRGPWKLGRYVGDEARGVVEAAGLTVHESWNGNRSMTVNLEMHPSVKAAFQYDHERKRAIGRPLAGGPKLPSGWDR